MSDSVISVENLGKKYRIRHEAERQRYVALRDVLAQKLSAPLKLLRRKMGDGRSKISTPLSSPNSDLPTSISQLPPSRASHEEFWALRDVSFEVRRGEVVGIIGRNGAGKSTLLKILSRITEPTEGRVRIKGRVASLLEVGTGFHPELTGRENIFLNGAILGMTRAEITRKFDEIVAFAEVEKFLDTPVKRYSSGMYVRLAFAVAAHLEPEILIVDEVLAVGDAEFQKKCLGKLSEAANSGRTVLFVSHQMAAVQNFCQTGILLAQGRIERSGPVADIVKHYLIESTHLAELSLADRADRQGSGALRFVGVTFKDAHGQPIRALTCGSPATVELSLSNTHARTLRSVRLAVGIDNDMGQRIVVFSTHLASEDFPELPAEAETVEVRVPRLALVPGRYSFTLFASVNQEIADWIKNAGVFDVEGGDFYGSGQMPPQGQGSFVMDHEFSITSLTAPARV